MSQLQLIFSRSLLAIVFLCVSSCGTDVEEYVDEEVAGETYVTSCDELYNFLNEDEILPSEYIGDVHFSYPNSQLKVSDVVITDFELGNEFFHLFQFEQANNDNERCACLGLFSSKTGILQDAMMLGCSGSKGHMPSFFWEEDFSSFTFEPSSYDESIARDSIVKVSFQDGLFVYESNSIDISYESLWFLIDQKKSIHPGFLGEEWKNIRGDFFLVEQVVDENNEYLLMKLTSECDAMVTCGYLMSFSTLTGELISYIELGQEHETSSLDEIIFDADNNIQTTRYNYDLIESEMGDYIQGELLDTVIKTYFITNSGMINRE
ncbi:MAG: hypothetical protein QNK23_17890 [Crocinitomicaceae bacterium]|nr:hypothetical protein [Crocinitomicaceae bacterium]